MKLGKSEKKLILIILGLIAYHLIFMVGLPLGTQLYYSASVFLDERTGPLSPNLLIDTPLVGPVPAISGEQEEIESTYNQKDHSYPSSEKYREFPETPYPIQAIKWIGRLFTGFMLFSSIPILLSGSTSIIVASLAWSGWTVALLSAGAVLFLFKDMPLLRKVIYAYLLVILVSSLFIDNPLIWMFMGN